MRATGIVVAAAAFLGSIRVGVVGLRFGDRLRLGVAKVEGVDVTAVGRLTLL